MNKNKKMVITIAVLAVMLFAMTMSLVVVLVLSNQRAKSNINVKYTASDVMVKISAKAYEGVNTYTFKNGTATTLELSPNNMEGSLSQTEEEIILTKTAPRIIFEYKFENMTTDIDAVIACDGIPATQENVKLSYATSDSEVQILNAGFQNLLNFTDTYTTQLLPAYPNASQNVRYVYVMAEIESLVHDAEFSGDFIWGLSKPADNLVKTINVQNNLSQTPTVSAKYLAGTDLFEPGFDQYEDAMFEGFYTDSTYTNRIEFPYTSTLSGDIYAKYLQGSPIPTSNISYDEASDSYHVVGQLNSSFTNDTLIIPDLYDDGINGVKPITKVVAEVDDSGEWEIYWTGLLYGANVKNLFIGNNVTAISYIANRAYGPDSNNPYYLSGSNNVLEYVYLGRGVKRLGSALEKVSSLNKIDCSNKLIIGTSTPTFSEDSDGIWPLSAFDETGVSVVKPYDNPNRIILVSTADATDVSQITDYEIVNEINQGAFVKSKLTSLVLPEFVSSITDCMFACSSLQSITLHNKLESIGYRAFKDCKNLNAITIPSSVKSISQEVFLGCDNLWVADVENGPMSNIVFEDTTSTWIGKSHINTITMVFNDPYIYISYLGPEYANHKNPAGNSYTSNAYLSWTKQEN